MASFANQLKQVKLRKVTEPIKDYSSPKTAGYVSQEEITQYQNSVIDVNAEKWMDHLKDLTFPTLFCPLTLEEARLFIQIFEEFYQNVEPNELCGVDWKKNMSPERKDIVDSITERLELVMQTFTNEDGYAFVKTSSRSAKDAPLAQKRFKDMYRKFLSDVPEADRANENVQVTCLLKAGFEALKVSTAAEVVDMMFRSERIFQDMLLAVEVKDRFHENFVVRKFVQMDVDMEFRGFVYDKELVALSQYNYLIFSQRLVDRRDQIKSSILQYFENEVKPKLEDTDFPSEYIIDFAVCDDDGEKLWTIEINPFASTTDGGLFSWEHERHILEGKEGFQLRIVEKPRPGVRAMLPRSLKDLLNGL